MRTQSPIMSPLNNSQLCTIGGPPLDIGGGGGWSFWLAISIYFISEFESFIFLTSG